MEKITQFYNDLVSFILKVLSDLGFDMSKIPEWVYLQPIA